MNRYDIFAHWQKPKLKREKALSLPTSPKTPSSYLGAVSGWWYGTQSSTSPSPQIDEEQLKQLYDTIDYSDASALTES